MKIYIPVPAWKGKSLLDRLQKYAEVIIAEKRPTQEEFEEIVKDYDGVIIGRLHFINKKVLETSNLKFVGLIAKGSDNIDKEECAKKNVTVFYTPEANITSVAEHVIALMLSLSKNIVNLDKHIREGLFDEHRYTTIDVREKTLGVIGAGPIAAEVIKRAKSFAMKILCYTKHPDNHKDLEVEFVSLNKLLEASDFISVNIPYNNETHNIIGEKEFSLMKKTAFLINTSRGGVVSEKATVDALKNKIIAGAGIDVYEEEPTHNKELFELDNVILTPHVAGVSKEALDRMEEHVIMDTIAFLEGKEPKYRLV
jgi:phosphoglycerate dehydrogenase-like enzyme